MVNDVRRDDASGRYELVVDGEVVGIASFQVDGNRVILPHTEIDPERRGEGLGAILVKGVLGDVRRAGRTVVPACWYVARYIDEHPSEHDLLTA